MSFCYLLNAVLLFGSVVAFIIAGFAGTFSQRLHSCRYRLMLAPLGFLVLGSLSHSIIARIMLWLAHNSAQLHAVHAGRVGSGADIFETAVLLLAGIAGVLAGIAFGATLDRVPAHEQTYTIANYWNRRRSTPARSAAAQPSAAARNQNVIAISGRKKQQATVRRVNAPSANE